MNDQHGYTNRNLSVAALATVCMVIVMRMQGHELVNAISPRGILDLEFANSPQRIQELILNWDISKVKMNIWLDFVFIVTYVLLFSIAAAMVAVKWPENSLLKQTGMILSRIAYVAGILDIVENLFMLQSLQGHYSSFTLQLTYYCALIKFLLLLLIIIYLLISLPVIIKRK